MNGVFALCHFCEQHGPRIVFSTQAFHSIGANPEDFVEERPSDVDGHSLLGEDLSLLDVSHSSLGSAASSFNERTDEAAAGIADGCAACRWPVAVPGFVTYDESAKTTYVSTHYPRRSELFSTVRRACVRSLSCEVCPGREGPLLFGDEEHGYVFSYAFFLKDHEARGMQRWYSIILVMSDHVHLISSWPFLVAQMSRLVAVLQTKAGAVDARLQAKLKEREDPMRQRRHPRMGMRPGLFRGGGSHKSKTLRSMMELLEEQDVFLDLHAYLAWVLKSSISRLFERQIEGPSSIGESLAPEKAQEVWGLAMEAAEDEGQFSLLGGAENAGQSAIFDSLLRLYQAMEPDHFALVVFNAIIGNQVIVRGPAHVATSILLVLASLLPSRCCDILPNQPEYHASYECNFLGLAAGVEVPSHVKRASFIMMELRLDGDTLSSTDELLFVLHAANMAEAMRGNTLLNTITRFFAREHSDIVTDQYLCTVREEWMQYAKAFFKFRRSEFSAGKDPPIHAFVQSLSLCEEDVPVLKFWSQGLSKEHRVKLLMSGRETE